ncbi:MAG: DUF6036 family nucleotidyltransferase [Thermoleophilia bacterium]
MAPIEAAEYQRIIDFLKALDNKLNKRALLYLIGGGAITLAYAPENRTADIDVIDVNEEITRLGGIESELAKEFGVYISPLFDITFSAPSGWRSRCRLLELDLQKLEIRVADPYDITLGKIARLEPKDIEDILSLTEAGQIEIDRLLERLNDNLIEVNKFPHYRQNALLLFGDILKQPIVFKHGRARFV